MGRSIGVLATGHLWAGIVEDAVLGTVKMYPDPAEPQIDLKTIPAGDITPRWPMKSERLLDSLGTAGQTRGVRRLETAYGLSGRGSRGQPPRDLRGIGNQRRHAYGQIGRRAWE